MPVYTVNKYICDLCSKEYNPETTEVSEYSGERLTAMRIDGYYKPVSQAIIKCICLDCQSKILKVVNQIKESN